MLRASTVRHFSTIAPKYRALRQLDMRAVRDVSFELAALSGAARSVTVLDVGTGTGRYAEAVLRDAGDRVNLPFHGVAYDAVPAMLRSGTGHRTLVTGSIDRAVGLAERLPFADGSFHAVLSFNAVHHFDLGRFLGEAARVLRIGGRLILYTRTPEQNRRTIWGRLFPDFAERETRLYTESTLCRAVEKARRFESVELRELPWLMRTSLARLLEHARSGGYSTFRFYSTGEFRQALKVFEARVRAMSDDLSAVTARNDHVMVLATRC